MKFTLTFTDETGADHWVSFQCGHLTPTSALLREIESRLESWWFTTCVQVVAARRAVGREHAP